MGLRAHIGSYNLGSTVQKVNTFNWKNLAVAAGIVALIYVVLVPMKVPNHDYQQVTDGCPNKRGHLCQHSLARNFRRLPNIGIRTRPLRKSALTTEFHNYRQFYSLPTALPVGILPHTLVGIPQSAG